ncbi:amino acid permease [Microbacterium rhizomatis]|uniref:Amino acid permease n=1 Tax=Microbacterium rhizomatis TaxID=1631477 RepID=A0A5J5J1N9_9MICO|nr:amino acid permease [Microbacterium rhizomatis]KAA9108287.1 amino acid permease [Microbacterium rhizomatis]
MGAREKADLTLPVVDPRGEAETPAGFESEQTGYHKDLKRRHLQMIAIGGAIGTGLFLGAGGRLAGAGPALTAVYLVCGVFSFLILRALGELVLHRPSSGSFVSYAREFFGEKFAFVSGWMYFLNWAMTGIVDVTAAALYLQFWGVFTSIPQWALALIALAVVVSINLVSVKLFGEMEFWFAAIKVTALVVFLVVGAVFLGAGWPTEFGPTGFSMINDNGGWLPNGLLAAVIMTQGVVFAYAAIELVGTAAGETKDPEKVMPRAINSVILRIGVFYVGSVLLLSLLLPYTAFEAGVSPFVTFFSSIGSPQLGEIAGSVMNFVVLTAALSSLNAGLYSTGRILHSMSVNGSAPKFTSLMSKQGVPYGGVLLTGAIALLGVGLNAIVPEQAFEIVLNIAALGIIASWATIVLCQMRLQAWAKQGKLVRPSFRMPGAPVTSWITLAFLFAVIVLMGLDYPVGTFTVSSLVVIIPLLIAGWYFFRGRILEVAKAREGLTGSFPTVANRPGPREASPASED